MNYPDYQTIYISQQDLLWDREYEGDVRSETSLLRETAKTNVVTKPRQVMTVSE